MFDRSRLSLVPEVVILAGVVLLVTSVFHPLLTWFGAIAMALGILWLLAECLQSRLWSNPGAEFAEPPTGEPYKES